MFSPCDEKYSEDAAYLGEMLELFKEETLSFVEGKIECGEYDRTVGRDRTLGDGRHCVTQFPSGHERLVREITGELVGHRTLSFVGFFGRRIVNIKTDLVSRMNGLQSKLSALLCEHCDVLLYGFAELKSKKDYFNLVVLRNEEAGKRWRECELHQQMAVKDLSPQYYTSIRIHTGELPDGLDSKQLNLKRSVFLDYTAHQKDPNAPIHREVKMWTQ